MKHLNTYIPYKILNWNPKVASDSSGNDDRYYLKMTSYDENIVFKRPGQFWVSIYNPAGATEDYFHVYKYGDYSSVLSSRNTYNSPIEPTKPVRNATTNSIYFTNDFKPTITELVIPASVEQIR